MKKALSLSLHASDSDSVPQEYTQWNLSTGVKARLGKGRTSDVLNLPDMTYFSDGKCFVVVSAIGIWIYDVATDKTLYYLQDMRVEVIA